MTSATHYLAAETRRVCRHPAPWAGMAACVCLIVWWWSTGTTRTHPPHRIGALLALDIEGAPALVAIVTAVAVGLSGCAGDGHLGRTDYLRLRGVTAAARAVAAALVPAAVTFVAALGAQGLALAWTVVRLPSGATALPSMRHPVGTWAEWMSPPLPPTAPAWLPDVVGAVAFAAVAAGVAAVTATLWRATGSLWLAGLLALAATTVLEMGLGPLGLPMDLSPWWRLSHRSPWLHSVVYGAVLTLFAFAITLLIELREERR